MYNEKSFQNYIFWTKVRRIFLILLFSTIGCLLGIFISDIIQTITVNDSYDPEPTTHNCETRYKTYYSTHSNEYHTTVEYLEESCLCCGKIINSYEEYFDLECHEFDDSVDPEVDTEGVCILCSDEVSW